MSTNASRVLLTGATGFVGGYLYPELLRAGMQVRCLTRNVGRAQQRWPEREWIEGDVCDPEQMRRALEGCDAAYYLVHGMSEGHGDFHQRELAAAEAFRSAAAAVGVSRVVYLGGLEPQGPPTPHLQSRLEVGEALREGAVPTVELRASMIVGWGSLSWLIVRDLAARLPVMVLPSWLRSRTQPVAVDDVIAALARSLDLPLTGSACYDLPGPDTMTGREILERTAELMGYRKAGMLEVPVLSPWLSSHWIRFVTRADWAVARELVAGMAHDFLARDDRFWHLIGHRERIDFDEAARRALARERLEAPAGGFWGAMERWHSRIAPVRAAR